MTTTSTDNTPRIDLGRLQLALAFFAAHPVLPSPTRLEIHRFDDDYAPDVEVSINAKLASRAELDAWADALGATVREYPSHAVVGELDRLRQDVYGTTISVELVHHHGGQS